MEFVFDNVNDAFDRLVQKFASYLSPYEKAFNNDFDSTPSRVGCVIRAVDPVLIRYRNHQQRVLFNPARDANPFFHLAEAMWMLAGRNDVAPMEYFSSNIGQIASDDGVIFNGAYGLRWRYWNEDPDGDAFNTIDQLELIAQHLAKNPLSRRAVLQMWSPQRDLLKVDVTKDVCCNTQVMFDTSGGESSTRFLNMTVINRSNDLVWGLLGANFVQFSFLMDYMLYKIRHFAKGSDYHFCAGNYRHISNNLHVYTERFNPGEWLKRQMPISEVAGYYPEDVIPSPPLMKDAEQFETELICVTDRMGIQVPPDNADDYDEPFFRDLFIPMLWAFHYYKQNDLAQAVLTLDRQIESVGKIDWLVAGSQWLLRRLEKRRAKADPYSVKELGP